MKSVPAARKSTNSWRSTRRKSLGWQRPSCQEMRAIVPGAIELVYDNYNALVIGFGPTKRAAMRSFPSRCIRAG